MDTELRQLERAYKKGDLQAQRKLEVLKARIRGYHECHCSYKNLVLLGCQCGVDNGQNRIFDLEIAMKLYGFEVNTILNDVGLRASRSIGRLFTRIYLHLNNCDTYISVFSSDEVGLMPFDVDIPYTWDDWNSIIERINSAIRDLEEDYQKLHEDINNLSFKDWKQ